MVIISNSVLECSIKPYLSWDSDVRFISLSLVNDVDAIDEDVLQAAPEIWCTGQVMHILLYDTSYI